LNELGKGRDGKGTKGGKRRKKRRKKATGLAGDLAAVEGRGLGDVELVVRQRVDVDGVEPVVAVEELVPEREERERAARHEEEGDLGHALEGEVVGPGHERGPPEELVVGHGVREARRVDERLERQAGGAAVAVAAAVGGGREEELGVGVARDAAADAEAQDEAAHEDDHGGDEAEQAGGPPVRARGVVGGLLVARRHQPADGAGLVLGGGPRPHPRPSRRSRNARIEVRRPRRVGWIGQDRVLL
jgi:hypothetical protein